jgi:CRP-like cAMP-binding protein
MKSGLDHSLQSLKQLTEAIHPMSFDAWEDFSAIWQPISSKRKVVVTSFGQTERHLYFVVEGVQRVFYSDENGREATLVFTYPPSFGGVLDSFLTQKPSRYSFETLTPSIFLQANYSTINQLMLKHHSIERLIRIGLGNVLSGLLERQVELQCFSSEEKFKALLKRSPHVLQLIPHKYLANYLGIDATNFSKLLGTVRI